MLREMLAQEPNMSDALLLLSNALGDQGRTDDQLAVLQRAARIDPLHPSIAGNLSNALAQQGEVRQAIRVLERQLEKPRVVADLACRDELRALLRHVLRVDISAGVDLPDQILGRNIGKRVKQLLESVRVPVGEKTGRSLIRRTMSSYHIGRHGPGRPAEAK